MKDEVKGSGESWARLSAYGFKAGRTAIFASHSAGCDAYEKIVSSLNSNRNYMTGVPYAYIKHPKDGHGYLITYARNYEGEANGSCERGQKELIVLRTRLPAEEIQKLMDGMD
jgi:hypothetical protein